MNELTRWKQFDLTALAGPSGELAIDDPRREREPQDDVRRPRGGDHEVNTVGDQIRSIDCERNQEDSDLHKNRTDHLR